MDIDALDRDTQRELRSLGPVGSRVGRHLLTAAAVVEDDPEEALRQLRAAVHRGSRLPIVRETAGVIGYAAGDFAFALRELRTAARLGAANHLLPLIVDCERALGRPDRALELAEEAGPLDPDTTAELAIVVSGIYRDRGDAEQALEALKGPTPGARTPSGVRLRYARAAALAAAGETEAAAQLFREVAHDDVEGLTDAVDRVAESEGLVFDDLADDEMDDDPDTVDDTPPVDDQNPAGEVSTVGDTRARGEPEPSDEVDREDAVERVDEVDREDDVDDRESVLTPGSSGAWTATGMAVGTEPGSSAEDLSTGSEPADSEPAESQPLDPTPPVAGEAAAVAGAAGEGGLSDGESAAASVTAQPGHHD